MGKLSTVAALALAISAHPGLSRSAAQEPRPSAAPAALVTALAWMAGSWAGTEGRFDHEEHWTAPGGGAMVGMHRTVGNGRMVEFEFLRIEERDGTLVYLSMPGGRSPATPFTLSELGRERVVFENATHDFPQRVLYWKDGAALRARIEGIDNGRTRSLEWRWAPSSLTRSP